ncbi:GyrI-like domain-containing protein [Alteribacter populi]|uniref:GyrI-like domain-containing protein n=1 Tax=Alteribacter populi TaxID=2011011 RepID=UPI000BBAF536|nr:effector binding domain-containing protein [Alteribacter populi]
MKIINKGEMKLVGIRVVCEGSDYQIEIPKAVEQLKRRKGEIPYLIDRSKLVGAFVVEENSNKEDDGYWACLQVSEFDQVPKGMTRLTIPAQSYAYAKHSGPVKVIFNTYEKLLSEIEASEYTRHLNAWHLEVYPHWTLETGENMTIELYDTVR